eukprot:snap_masked-scaffold_103-processed-gene-0.20-mRNA-1 protein AED:1.00 eAED:1.00 QI:0/-1/0/0/-1/1/1/0/171
MNSTESNTLLPVEASLRRSRRQVKTLDRLTYTDVVANDTKLLFEDVTLIFQQPTLVEYASVLVVKDKLIPKSYFQIKNKPEAEKWHKAYNKELNKLVKNGKIELVKKVNIDTKTVIPIIELYTKKTDNISKEQIYKCRFVARGDMQDEFFKISFSNGKTGINPNLYIYSDM